MCIVPSCDWTPVQAPPFEQPSPIWYPISGARIRGGEGGTPWCRAGTCNFGRGLNARYLKSLHLSLRQCHADGIPHDWTWNSFIPVNCNPCLRFMHTYHWLEKIPPWRSQPLSFRVATWSHEHHMGSSWSPFLNTPVTRHTIKFIPKATFERGRVLRQSSVICLVPVRPAGLKAGCTFGYALDLSCGHRSPTVVFFLRTLSHSHLIYRRIEHSIMTDNNRPMPANLALFHTTTQSTNNDDDTQAGDEMNAWITIASDCLTVCWRVSLVD